MVEEEQIRNFVIIAHIDHGKSTLADRFLEITGTISKENLKPQFLDSLALERERGITIKLAPVRMNYVLPQQKASSAYTLNAINYTLNLIDTPGHVDFSYEVSRSLVAVEGAILLVDASQGIQAQTLAHGLSALQQNLTLIPVVNKVDLPNANVKETKKQLVETFGFEEEEILLISAKTGQGVGKLLQAVIERIPAPKVDPSPQNSSGLRALRALVFDSFFDPFKGVIAAVRVVDGQVPSSGSKIIFLATGAEGQVLEAGIFSPQMQPVEKLVAGEIGYIATGIKEPDKVRVGDTISTPIESGSTDLNVGPLPGYKTVKPMVFVGLYPIDQNQYQDIKETLQKFRLNDPSFSFEPEYSQALGSGFRCGFLGLLHAEVVQQRLSAEFKANLLATAPSVEFMLGGKEVTNPSELDPSLVSSSGLKEPWVSLRIFTPQKFIGAVMDLAQDKRGKLQNIHHFGQQVELRYEMPLAEMVTDFYDRLKSVSSGFASLDWDFLEFREVDGVRLDILVAGEKVDALSQVVVRNKAESLGRRMVAKLKEVLPRQNFEVAIQAAVGGPSTGSGQGKIIARETLPAFRKDVTAKLYGGDRTRKNKLLEAQKKGKKRMKMVGKVEIPQEAFLNILKS